MASSWPTDRSWVVRTEEDDCASGRVVPLASGGRLELAECYDFRARRPRIMARLATSKGTPVRAPFEIGGEDETACHNPVAVELATGRIAVAWLATCKEGEPGGVRAAIYTIDGQLASGPRRVDPEPSAAQDTPMIAPAADGGFLVGWQAWERGTPGWSMLVRRFDHEGRPGRRCKALDRAGLDFRYCPRFHAPAEDGRQFATWRLCGRGREARLFLLRIDGGEDETPWSFIAPNDWRSDDFAFEPQPDGTVLLTWTSLYLGEKRQCEVRYDGEGRLISR